MRGRAGRRALSLVLAIAGCTSGQQASDALARARAQGIRVGFSVELPYAAVDSLGEATGEAPEILRHVARELGIGDVQWFPVPFHQLIEALLAGRIDVVASGTFITPERSRLVRFSRPTACVAPVLVVREEPEGRTAGGPADGGCPACGVAVIDGSVEQRAFEAADAPGTELIVVPDLSTAVAAVEEGVADALAISAPTGRRLVRDHPALALDSLPGHVARRAAGCPAFAFRPEDEELAAAFDSVLADFLGSPLHRRTVEPFGFTDEELACVPEGRRRSGPGAGLCPEPDLPGPE